MMEELKLQAARAVTELIEASALCAGQILVIGCSSSEIVGETIGHGSSLETAQAVFGAIYPIVTE